MPDRYFVPDPSGVAQAKPGVTTSGGTPGSLIATNSAGMLDATLIPGNLQITRRASEAISAGALINYWVDPTATTVISVRNADNSSWAKKADGFAPAAIASGASGTIMEDAGLDTAISGLTIGTQYFLGSTGGVTATPPDPSTSFTPGQIVQFVGVGTGTGALSFRAGAGYVLKA